MDSMTLNCSPKAYRVEDSDPVRRRLRTLLGAIDHVRIARRIVDEQRKRN
jgi:hypothetical protein